MSHDAVAKHCRRQPVLLMHALSSLTASCLAQRLLLWFIFYLVNWTLRSTVSWYIDQFNKRRCSAHVAAL